MSIPAFKAAGNPSVSYWHDETGISEDDPVFELRADSRFLAGVEGYCKIVEEKRVLAPALMPHDEKLSVSPIQPGQPGKLPVLQGEHAPCLSPIASLH